MSLEFFHVSDDEDKQVELKGSCLLSTQQREKKFEIYLRKWTSRDGGLSAQLSFIYGYN